MLYLFLNSVLSRMERHLPVDPRLVGRSAANGSMDLLLGKLYQTLRSATRPS